MKKRKKKKKQVPLEAFTVEPSEGKPRFALNVEMRE